MSQKFRYLDYWVLIPFLILMGIGIVMVYSASFDTVMKNGGVASSYFIKQIMYAIVGLFLCTIMYMLKWKHIRNPRNIVLFLALTIILLASLIVLKIVHPSSAINGAVAWIPLGPLGNLQPLELAKLALIFYFAYTFDRHKNQLTRGHIWDEVSKPIMIALFMILLVFVQPDTGGAAILFFIGIVLISTSGIPLRTMAILNGAWVSFIAFLYFILTHFHIGFLEKSYQYKRFMAFTNPFKYESSIGSQLVNSLYAISNGGMFGVGLGNSIQKRGYLPEPYTDFILAITSEELGFVGVFVILGLLFQLMIRCIQIGIRTTDTFSSLVAFGISAMLFAQTFLNVGGLLGLIPLTGVTLPFISYGGSSLIILSISMGLILNISAMEKMAKSSR